MPNGSAQYKVRSFDVEPGENIAILNEAEAKRRNIEIGDRLLIRFGKREVIAVTNHSKKYIGSDEIGLFAETLAKIGVADGGKVTVEKAQRPQSLDFIRKKLDGATLTEGEIGEIIADVMEEKFSIAELSALVSAIYIRGLSPDEIVGLTNAMVGSGETMKFGPHKIVASEHSIGGVAGDRVSMLIVPIVASLGVTIPKTASRAISSASGTADAMEVLAPVELTKEQVEEVAKKTGGALVWGGGVNIAVADDKLIKVRNPLRLDPPGLLLSSILSKKKAEGAHFVLLDIPTGRGTKIENLKEANALAANFKQLSTKLGMELNVIITDGSDPVISTIGPALEARAVLQTLADGGATHPQFAEKALVMSGLILELAKGISREKAYDMCRQALKSGAVDRKFREIIEAQGGNPDIKPSDISIGSERFNVVSDVDGKIQHIDNKAIFRLCRALGAPSDKKAGIILRVRKEQRVRKGEVLYEMITSSKAALEYARARQASYQIVEIERVILNLI